MENIYLYDNDVEDEFIKKKFSDYINKSKMYKNDSDLELLMIEKKYIIYPFINGSINNLGYFYVKGSIEKNGVINGEYRLISSDFFIKELNKEKFIKTESRLDEFSLYNPEIINKSFNDFLYFFNERVKDGICQRHNLKLLLKENKLDIGVIKEFDVLEKEYYLEGVYIISYLDKKKKYISIYSTLQNKFYSFDFIKNDMYLGYLKAYKKTVVAIPKEFYDLYYKISYKIYLEVLNELDYITKEDLYIKSKDNIKYKKNIKYYEYLNKLIFYYKKSKYLSIYECDEKELYHKVFFYYLTLNHNPESGYALAMLVKLGVIKDGYTKLLEKSFKLGSLQAKKALNEYYNKPQYYNENMIKKYD